MSNYRNHGYHRRGTSNTTRFTSRPIRGRGEMNRPLEPGDEIRRFPQITESPGVSSYAPRPRYLGENSYTNISTSFPAPQPQMTRNQHRGSYPSQRSINASRSINTSQRSLNPNLLYSSNYRPGRTTIYHQLQMRRNQPRFPTPPVPHRVYQAISNVEQLFGPTPLHRQITARNERTPAPSTATNQGTLFHEIMERNLTLQDADVTYEEEFDGRTVSWVDDAAETTRSGDTEQELTAPLYDPTDAIDDLALENRERPGDGSPPSESIETQSPASHLTILSGTVYQLPAWFERLDAICIYETIGTVVGCFLKDPELPANYNNEMTIMLKDKIRVCPTLKVIYAPYENPKLPPITTGASIRCVGKMLNKYTMRALKITFFDPIEDDSFYRTTHVCQKRVFGNDTETE